MKFKFLAIIGLTATLYSCDDSTTGIGDFVADEDQIKAYATTYNVETKTVKVSDISDGRGVYSRTSSAYLGKITDPDFGEFTADFITQVNCPEDFAYPSTFQKITSTQLELYYMSYYGDSLAPMKVGINLLKDDVEINDDGNDADIYYTTYDPYQYAQTQVIGEKDYAAYDKSVSDSIRNATNSSGQKTYYPSVVIDLDKTKVPGTDMTFSEYLQDMYVNHREYFKDANTFINNVLKGFYVHNTSGEGSVLYIQDIWLRTYFDYTIKGSQDQDSTVSSYYAFAATKEIFMSTRLNNDEKLDDFVTDANKTKDTYLKTPAGLWTEITLPLEQMYDDLKTDTLNSVSLTLTKYRNTIENRENGIEMGTPQYLLLLRKNDLKEFFEGNHSYDNRTSFLATYNSTTNSYSFSSLNRLISYIFAEMRNSDERPEGWDKLLLVPVQVEKDSQNKVIGISSHDLEVNSARLFKGSNDNPLQITVIYTKPHGLKD